MKRTLFLATTAFVSLSFLFVACGGDDDEKASACDELIDVTQDAVDLGCKDYPDCSVCSAEASTDEAADVEATEEQCQQQLDTFDSDAMTTAVKMACTLEATAADAASVDTDTDGTK